MPERMRRSGSSVRRFPIRGDCRGGLHRRPPSQITFLGHTDRHKVVQRSNEEVSRSAARIEDFQFCGSFRPPVERARARPPRPLSPSAPRTKRSTPSPRRAGRACGVVRLPSWQWRRPCDEIFASPPAPSVLWRRNSTMYGSVKSCVTAAISSAPILTSERLTSSFFLLCQNW